MESSKKNDKWIFLVPIDANINKSVNKKQNQPDKCEQNQEKSEIKIKEKDDDEYFNKNFIDNTNIDNIDNKSNMDNNSNIKNTTENQDNSKIYTYSFLSKYNDKSKADSSKIYMSEFLKKNWKIKIKRLIIKLKKRYTKQADKIIFEDPKNINNNDFSDFNNNKININPLNQNFSFNNNSINFDNNSNINSNTNNNNNCFNYMNFE